MSLAQHSTIGSAINRPVSGAALHPSARALPDGASRTASAAHHQRLLENVFRASSLQLLVVKIDIHFRLKHETCELVVYLALTNIHVRFRLDLGTRGQRG